MVIFDDKAIYHKTGFQDDKWLYPLVQYFLCYELQSYYSLYST